MWLTQKTCLGDPDFLSSSNRRGICGILSTSSPGCQIGSRRLFPRTIMYEPLVGKLLIASSTIDDPIYSRGVCLVVHEDEGRTIGVMLNRPMQPSPETLLKMMGHGGDQPDREVHDESGETDEPRSEQSHDDFERDTNLDQPSTVNRLEAAVPSAEDEKMVMEASGSLGLVHFGGPLSGPVVAVHGSSDLAEAETGQGIYVAAQKQNLEDLVREKPTPYRLIVGHLGWEADQLAGEIDAGYWHLVPATADVVFDNDVDMWARLVRRATAHSVARWIGTADVPGAHQLN